MWHGRTAWRTALTFLEMVQRRLPGGSRPRSESWWKFRTQRRHGTHKMSFYPALTLLWKGLQPLKRKIIVASSLMWSAWELCHVVEPSLWREFYILLNILKFDQDTVQYQPGSCQQTGTVSRRQGLDLTALFVFLMQCPRNVQQNLRRWIISGIQYNKMQSQE